MVCLQANLDIKNIEKIDIVKAKKHYRGRAKALNFILDTIDINELVRKIEGRE